jgi:lipopolysaccharide export system permease protein
VGLLDRYLAREILLPFAAALLFLTQILLATQVLAQADVLFGSGVSLVDLGLMILALMPHFLGYVIPVAFLLGAVLGVGRLAEDREVVALGAAGLSPARLVRVPLALGVVVAAAGLWLSLSVEPASMRAARLRLNDIVKRNVTNDVRPGTFYDQIPGYTLYAERVRGGRWENVLIHDRSTESAPVLALARRGRLEPVGAGEEMRLVLEDGEVHREEAGTDEYVTAGFGRAEVMVGLGTALRDRSGLASASRELTLGDLRARIADARARGDGKGVLRFEGYLHRRISAPLAVIAFAILAVPIGAVRRGGRAFGVGATFLLVVAHYILLRGGEVLTQRGDLPAALALQLPNLVLSAVGLVLVAALARRGPGAVR